MKKPLSAVIAILLALAMATPARLDAAVDARTAAVPSTDAKDAIVKIYTYHEVPDYQNPWSMRGTFASTGSGCIIGGRRILSNAHVVSDQRYIQVRRYGDARRYEARLLWVSHAADLALLTVDDPEFFEGVEPLEFGELPHAQQEVLVYGFPLGGDTLSITKGVVSRVEHQQYVHSSCSLLACQIDAAINPGNSGGPALVGNRVVGVAMQGISKADNIGYIVPVPIIQHFLDDIGDGRYDGFPSVGLVLQGMENPDLKKRYGLGPKETGMLALQVVRGSPAEGVLEENDVLLSVEGHTVADDGTVEFRGRERTSISYYIQAHQVGEDLEVEILRDGERREVKVSLFRSLENDWLIPNEQYDVLPRYFIYGGLVFCPLTKSLLQSWGPNWYDQAPKELVAMLNFNHVVDEVEEIVLVLEVLAADVNRGYQDFGSWVVAEVNGRKVTSFRQLVEAVEDEGSGPFAKFSNKWGQQILLDRERVRESMPRLLATYHIPYDRSPDLRGAADDAEPAPAGR